MSDSALDGTVKKDHSETSKPDADRKTDRDPRAEDPKLQQRQGQPGGTNQGQPAQGGPGSDPAGKASGSQKRPDAKTGEQHIRSISTPPGEPYNDPRVRGH